MCGIVGALAWEGERIEVRGAKRMADILWHRGPDDGGYLFIQTGCREGMRLSFSQIFGEHSHEGLPRLDRVALQKLRGYHWDLFLGHRRLSILDLGPAGHQPMGDLSRNIWVTYNGEIYNFRELRKFLEGRGYPFRSQTDTEVLIYAYLEWGIECVHRLNGMFAFALYDNYRKRLYLVRDRFGVKPLYYTVIDGSLDTFLFASEVKGILAYDWRRVELDYQALAEYFTFQNIFSYRTLYGGISILEPGHYLELDIGSRSYRKHRYWDFEFSNSPSEGGFSEYLEGLKVLFEGAVKRQLVADVEVGSYLSGGIDTSCIVAVASRQLSYLKTFTIGFDLHSISGMELTYDEREKAEYFSYLFKTEHYEMVLKAGDMERCLPRFAYHLEEPRVGQSYPNFYASNLASRFVKVVLSGTGGDELFAGYPWRYYRHTVNRDFDDYIQKYFNFWQRLIGEEDFRSFFAPIWREVREVDLREIFRGVFPRECVCETPQDYINLSLYFEAKTFLHGLLTVEDKLSMAHSLESRVPFLDNELVEFAQRIPVDFKLANLGECLRINENEIAKPLQYYLRTRDGKVILRRMARRYIPEEMANGWKQGFSSPDRSWFKGESLEFVRSRLLREGALIYDFFDRETTFRLVEEHLSGSRNRRLFIWSLLNFEQWLEIFMKGDLESFGQGRNSF
ncbi:MAG: asparagine synthase (glutamine-hydrolyzing) [Planctomycetota bacterium]|nr:MAG: asparagine synthase (glutamine-hydrolyzing) [Planctomycetota bacterium]